MKTTRAMLVVGILMLVLAVIVARGLKPEEKSFFVGQEISGAVSSLQTSPQVQTDVSVPTSNPGGTLIPLDAGTLKMDSTAVPGPAGAEEAKSAPAVPEAAVEEKEETKAPAVASAADTVPSSTAAAPVQEQTKKPEPKERQPLVVTTSAPARLAPGQKAIARTRLEIGDTSATFRMTGAEKLQGKAFVLKSPDRVVVDLNGPWAINLGKTPANKLIKSVRSGNEQANTRIVFDMLKAPKSYRLTQESSKTLSLQIR